MIKMVQVWGDYPVVELSCSKPGKLMAHVSVSAGKSDCKHSLMTIVKLISHAATMIK
jgi:hypothetical protein